VSGDDTRGSVVGPLTDAALHILIALGDGERHGYAIMHEIETRTQGEVVLDPGTLYRAIKRLLAASLIEEAAERPDPDLDDQRRRYYSLTALGQSVAVAELERRERTARAARMKPLFGGVS